jgi:hypothetical protein
MGTVNAAAAIAKSAPIQAIIVRRFLAEVSTMSAVRSVLFWALFGGLAGTWTGGLISRAFLPWFNTPGAGIMSQCACEPLAISTVSHTLQIELGGLVSGALVFAVLAIVLGAGRKRKVEPSAPATPPAAAA